MDRPYVICHILSALDGKITGAFMGTESARAMSSEYARIRGEYKADAWLYGTVTTKGFLQRESPELTNRLGTDVPKGDFAAENNASLYYVSIDTKGELGWESGTFRMPGRPDSHVIEVLTEETSMAYRGYLRQRGVSYIVAGKKTLDGMLVMEKLQQLFGINKVLICGGGVVNWTFLQQGVVDELSLLIAPAADGTPNSVTVFEKLDILPPSAPVEFQLKEAERIKTDGIRLVYSVKN